MKRLKQLLLWLANLIDNKDSYSFGAPIVAMQIFEDQLFVATSKDVYVGEKENKTFRRLERK